MTMRTVRLSNAEVMRAWLDTSRTLTEHAGHLGAAVETIQRRAKLLELPRRKCGRREVIGTKDEREFLAMWDCGVSAREIGRAYGCSYFAVVNTARRLGREARTSAFRARMRLRDFREMQLAERIAVVAKSEDAAIAKRIGRDIVTARS